ncbi:MAG: RNA 2',3'-cyclic phosphodiesterase [Patescibacteria group bacterium]|nr:RNA 2',3'-cyclic phosphodiesterase [Patescibacteria group bacterium]
MRLFLGIKVPDDSAQKIYRALENLRNDYAWARWVNPDNYHITIHFFGERPGFSDLLPILEEAVFEAPPFELDLLSGGVFQYPELVLYVDFYRARALEILAKRVAERFSNGGKIYRFIPHVTVARMKKPSKQQYLHLKKRMTAFQVEHRFRVEEVCLFESVQHMGRVGYISRANFTLEG